ncbi:hypothetical protein LY71_1269 [Geodermatophilus tzadiensis]|uniref:Uncharacterized protein n=1 Tax=Geodermatophilus tzadiensis TaxID=1137988 RepID=A0A2T0SRM4_9ACTN|nr:hypothetical protein [Geodermatophilus tzadiensis]PRY36048.1 hypothetical protein LY71_1269 [Geodermatophilus tzadiensis]
MPDRRGIAGTTLLVTVAAAALTACGSGTSSSAGTSSSGSSFSSTRSPAAAEPSGPEPYSTQAFVVPLTLEVDTWLTSVTPEEDSAHLVYWSAAVDDSRVRFLVPVVTYVPGTGSPTDPPADFVSYLHSQPDFQLEDEAGTEVDGRPATVMTATSQPGRAEGYYDGSLGCVSSDAEIDDPVGCFGLQPDRELRLAVIDLGDETLLAWARIAKDSPDAPELFEHFETMLSSIRFR